MVDAFSLKELAARLSAKGLPIAEDAVQDVTKEIFAWAAESCAIKGGMFMVGVPLLPILADQMVKLEDKIDGVVGQ